MSNEPNGFAKYLVIFVDILGSQGESSACPRQKSIKFKRKKCLSPAKKYKLYKSSINKSIHFVQRSLSSSTRG